MALVKYNNNSISAVTSAASIPSGAMTHIKTLTASSSANLSFVHGTSDVVLDSTYPIYKFVCTSLHCATDGAEFQVGFRDGGTNYDANKTTTNINTYNGESGSPDPVGYPTGGDLAESTAAQRISPDMGNENDEASSGELFLFSPSSTTYVKHFLSRFSVGHGQPAILDFFVQGYCNTTTAIDGVQFSMSSGNLDAGTIKLYGIKDS